MEAAKCGGKKTGLDGSIDKYLYTNEDRSLNSQHSHRNSAGMTLPVFQALRRERRDRSTTLEHQTSKLWVQQETLPQSVKKSMSENTRLSLILPKSTHRHTHPHTCTHMLPLQSMCPSRADIYLPVVTDAGKQ